MKSKKVQKEANLEKIRNLFSKASSCFAESKENSSLCDRYVSLAIKLSQKTQNRIPRELKRRYCPHCKCYLVSPHNLRIRIQNGKVIYLCRICKHISRFPLKKK